MIGPALCRRLLVLQEPRLLSEVSPNSSPNDAFTAEKTHRAGQTGPEAKRSGANAMDFARGPAEMVQAIQERRRSRVPADFSLHFNEVTLAIQNDQSADACYMTQSTFEPLAPVDHPII